MFNHLSVCVFNRLKFIHSNFGPNVHLLIAYFLEIQSITGVASAIVYSVKIKIIQLNLQ